MTFVEICVATIIMVCLIVAIVGAVHCIATAAARDVIAEMKRKGEL